MTNRNKKIRVINFRWLMIFLVVCAVFFGSQVLTILEMNQQIHTLALKKEQLIKENRKFKAGVKAINSDEMLEKLAREELGMIKPGEKILVEVIPQD